MDKTRALAHIEKIAWIKPIKDADNIELVGVLGWRCVAKKGEFKEGDFCVYIEIDSKVPETEQFEFLRNKHFKIKTMKLNKFKDETGNPIVSQGIALPVKEFQGIDNLNATAEGFDVTELLDITYADPEDVKRKTVNPEMVYQKMRQQHKKLFSNKLVKKLMRYTWFRKVMFKLFGRKADKTCKFPSWIQKTDEERIENRPDYLADHKTMWEMTEKIDGTSTTFAMERPKKKFIGKEKYELIVCSRNYQVHTGVYQEMAEKYQMQEALRKILKVLAVDKVIVQGETYGPNIQKNPYKKDTVQFAAFNLTVIHGSQRRRYDYAGMHAILCALNIPCVPFLGYVKFDDNVTMDTFKKDADGVSQLKNVKREGIVYRNTDNPEISFKNVSNEYLLKEK